MRLLVFAICVGLVRVATADPAPTLVISITSDEHILVGARAVEDKNLDALLRALAEQDRERAVLVDADAHVPRAHVNAMVDRAKHAGLRHVTVGAPPPTSGPRHPPDRR
jgi:biopolymer transport protein ExbD